MKMKQVKYFLGQINGIGVFRQVVIVTKIKPGKNSTGETFFPAKNFWFTLLLKSRHDQMGRKFVTCTVYPDIFSYPLPLTFHILFKKCYSFMFSINSTLTIVIFHCKFSQHCYQYNLLETNDYTNGDLTWLLNPYTMNGSLSAHKYYLMDKDIQNHHNASRRATDSLTGLIYNTIAVQRKEFFNAGTCSLSQLKWYMNSSAKESAAPSTLLWAVDNKYVVPISTSLHLCSCT